ncbi:hypothetical protein GHT06_020413 [Daphnia sinensis]|uniref:Uncharacterized protein n=1 Tax=Daphnia sinensis TaxID=1820382 RepID=A0AAD5KHS5_9CRUS|nr:hypothetical protein GHT06_020413 [Daphnia sinensis]
MRPTTTTTRATTTTRPTTTTTRATTTTTKATTTTRPTSTTTSKPIITPKVETPKTTTTSTTTTTIQTTTTAATTIQSTNKTSEEIIQINQNPTEEIGFEIIEDNEHPIQQEKPEAASLTLEKVAEEPTQEISQTKEKIPENEENGLPKNINEFEEKVTFQINKLHEQYKIRIETEHENKLAKEIRDIYLCLLGIARNGPKLPGLFLTIVQILEHHDEDRDTTQAIHPSTSAGAETYTPRILSSQCDNRVDNNRAREHSIQTTNPPSPTGHPACIFRDVRSSFPLSTSAPLFRSIAQIDQTRAKDRIHGSSPTLATRSERPDSPFVCICDLCNQRNKIHSPLCGNNGSIRERSTVVHHNASEGRESQTYNTTGYPLPHTATRNSNHSSERQTPERDQTILYKIQPTDQTAVRPERRHTPAVTFEAHNPIPHFPNTHGPVYYPTQEKQNPHTLWFNSDRADTLKQSDVYPSYPKEASYQTSEKSTLKEAWENPTNHALTNITRDEKDSRDQERLFNEKGILNTINKEMASPPNSYRKNDHRKGREAITMLN